MPAHLAPSDLDPVDIRLLVHLDQDPLASWHELAEQLGVGPRTVARRYKRLFDGKMIRVVGRTLPSFEGRAAWLTRATGDPEAIAYLARDIANRPNSRWVRTTRDGTGLIFGLVSGGDASDPTLGGLRRQPRLRTVEPFELLRVWSRWEGVVNTAPRSLDELDQAILDILARDGRTENRQVARLTGVDPSTASRRRKKLVDDGVLFFEADIHPAALGNSGDAMLWLQLTPGHIRELGGWLRTLPECRFAAATAGRFSIVANLLLETPDMLVDFLDDQLPGRGVLSYEITLLGETLKRNALSR